jgi:hypothetical protein
MGDVDPQVDTLPNTSLWPDDDLSIRMMDGSSRYIERRSLDQRAPPNSLNRNFALFEHARTNRPNRERFARIIGIADRRVATVMERLGHDNPALAAEI